MGVSAVGVEVLAAAGGVELMGDIFLQTVAIQVKSPILPRFEYS